jgi:ornithine cyclodeaminase/alanine dehydrogenase-like protein (mu-crystallin family)
MDVTRRASRTPFAPTLILSRADIGAAMTLADYRESAEEAFLALATGRGLSPAPLHIPAEGGGFHGKGARLGAADGSSYVALKLNGNFPGNRQRSGLPTIQGAVLLADASNGRLLAVMDSIEVTLRRTAAATALAARHLARRDAASLAICGCGEQAAAQLAALAAEFRLTRILAWNSDPAAVRALIEGMADRLGCSIEPAPSLAAATLASDIIVTCTTARAPFLDRDHVRPGTFIAAVGADNHDKSEIAPGLMAHAKVVVDVLEQCAEIGDLHHALAASAMALGDVHATLAEVVSGAKPGRADGAAITLFDSTGTAIQDVTAAQRIYRRASERGVGTSLDLGAANPSPADVR